MLFKKHGILGINARNLLYVKALNPRKAVKLADNKIKTKHFLSARDVPVPRLYGIINDTSELDRFDFNALPTSFVLKPNLGFGGEGIIPIIDRDKETGAWIKSSGEKIYPEEYRGHINDILDGRFSLSGVGDTAFFEQRIVADDCVAQYSYKGLPDIRVIVFNLIPVMAMLRLPTKESDGKGNLHLGAVGAGIDIASGKITHVMQHNKILKDMTGFEGIKQLTLPYWDDILYIASKIQLITNLGYLAVDIALDKTIGPVLLEINARAGLAVQIANLTPLRRRLDQIETIKVSTPEKGVRVAKDVFGNVISEKITEISGKKIIPDVNAIEIITANKHVSVLTKVDFDADNTVIDAEFAKESGIITEEEYVNEDNISKKIKFLLDDVRISTVARIKDLKKSEFNMYLGRRDLNDFLIDPQTKSETGAVLPDPSEVLKRQKIADKITELTKSIAVINHAEIDAKLVEIDRQIKLLHHLKPLNLEEELQKCREDHDYNPEFFYPELKFNPFELRKELYSLTFDDSDLSTLFEAKRDEILKKIALLEHVGSENFYEYSVALYGKPSQDLVKECQSKLKKMPKDFQSEQATISAEQAAEKFEAVFRKYGLKNWKVRLLDTLVSDCVAGKRKVLFVRKGAMFSEARIKSLIAHEIETHILSAVNGSAQPYKLFNRGLADYLITQEGLAIYNQKYATKDEPESQRDYWVIANVVAVDAAIKGSFSDTVKKICSYGIDHDRALRTAVKVKRGLEQTEQKGAFTKDHLYYKGYLQILDFKEKGGSLTDLYVGKLNSNDAATVKKMPIIKAPKLVPSWIKK